MRAHFCTRSRPDPLTALQKASYFPLSGLLGHRNSGQPLLRPLSPAKLRSPARKLYDYVRYDLKEIAFPSSLPDPPHIKKRRKLTWKERWLVLKEASRLYAASWVRDIGPDLRPNDYKKDADEEGRPRGGNGAGGEREPSTLEDLAVAARGGMETLKPALQRVYMTRASAYRDALKNFIVGYQEGMKQVMERKEGKDESQSEQQDDVFGKPR